MLVLCSADGLYDRNVTNNKFTYSKFTTNDRLINILCRNNTLVSITACWVCVLCQLISAWQITYEYRTQPLLFACSKVMKYGNGDKLYEINNITWRHNGHDGVSNHQPHNCLLNRLFRCTAKKTSKLRVTGLLCGELTGDRWIPHTKGQ